MLALVAALTALRPFMVVSPPVVESGEGTSGTDPSRAGINWEKPCEAPRELSCGVPNLSCRLGHRGDAVPSENSVAWLFAVRCNRSASALCLCCCALWCVHVSVDKCDESRVHPMERGADATMFYCYLCQGMNPALSLASAEAPAVSSMLAM